MDMQNNILPAERAVFRQCFNCDYEASTVNRVCPRCRRNKFFTSENIRIRGVIAALMGLFIAVLIGGVAVFVGLLLLGAANDPSSARRLAENEFNLLAIYGFFALMIGMGLHFVVTGGWMLVFGRRSRVLVWVMWALLAIVVGVGGLLTLIL